MKVQIFNEQLPDQLQVDQAINFLLTNYDQVIDKFDVKRTTAKKYKSDAKLFVNFVSENGLHLNTMRDYKEHLLNSISITTQTKRHKFIAAKLLLKELATRYRLLPVDVTAGVKNFQTSSEHKKDGLTEAEVQRLKKTILKEADDFKRVRLLALFNLLALQGLRQFEVCSLKVEDLHLSDQVAFIQGKGRDDQERIDLHPNVVAILREYLQLSGKKSGYLFTSISRAAKGNSALSERAVRKIFGQLFDQAKIPADRSVHGLRHFFVTRILEVTSGDLLTTQKFSRHKSLQTIKFYDDRKRKKELLPVYYTAFTNV